jgi:hypothetical protein
MMGSEALDSVIEERVFGLNAAQTGNLCRIWRTGQKKKAAPKGGSLFDPVDRVIALANRPLRTSS